MTTTKPPRVVSAAPRIRAKAQQERRSRRLRVLRRTSWLVLGCVPFVVAAWVLLASQLLAVTKVSVVGVARLSVAQVQRVVDVAPGTPLARVDTGAVARRLRALGPVASVSVSRSWPHELRIRIVERVVVAAQRQGPTYLLLDGTGALVATAPAIPRGVVLLASSSEPSTRAALGVLTSLPPTLRALLQSIQASSAEQVTLLLHDGRQVLWGGDGDNAVKGSAVTVLLRMPGRIFDVSAPGVATRR